VSGSGICWAICKYAPHSRQITDAEVDEQLIKLKTGHCSNAVRSYKRVSSEEMASYSDVVTCKEPHLEDRPVCTNDVMCDSSRVWKSPIEKYPYLWRNFCTTQCKISRWRPLCQKPARSVQPFGYNTGF